MTRNTLPIMAILGLFALAGCQPIDSSPTFAVIDLDVIAKRLGQDAKLDETIVSERAEVTQRLTALKEGFEKQLVQKKEEFGDELTEDEARLLLSLQSQANNHMTKAQHQAESSMRENAAKLVEQFREQARAIARAVAKERKLNLVVTKNPDLVFTYDSSIDITNEVADRMIAGGFSVRGPEKTAARSQATNH